MIVKMCLRINFKFNDHAIVSPTLHTVYLHLLQSQNLHFQLPLAPMTNVQVMLDTLYIEGYVQKSLQHIENGIIKSVYS